MKPKICLRCGKVIKKGMIVIIPSQLEIELGIASEETICLKCATWEEIDQTRPIK